MIILVWLLTVLLAGALGFFLGVRRAVGRVEAEVEAFQAAEEERDGVRLQRIVMRR